MERLILTLKDITNKLTSAFRVSAPSFPLLDEPGTFGTEFEEVRGWRRASVGLSIAGDHPSFPQRRPNARKIASDRRGVAREAYARAVPGPAPARHRACVHRQVRKEQ